MNGIKTQIEPLLQELIAEVWEVAKDDMAAYGTEIAEDFTRFLLQSNLHDDAVAKRNLEHLKVQVKLLAVKHRIALERGAMEKLAKAIGVVAQIALILLKTSL
jgi:hypothetical protein